MTCCNRDCQQGRTCPARRTANLAHALTGYGLVIALCTAAAALLVYASKG
jgi:hypothetical protein